MKPKLNRLLVLNKKTIANLNETTMGKVKGRKELTVLTECQSCIVMLCADTLDQTCITCGGQTCIVGCVDT